MTQLERIKPCVRVPQRRVEVLLLRVQLETMEIHLHKIFVIFTQNKVEKICDSLHNVIMRMGQQ